MDLAYKNILFKYFCTHYEIPPKDAVLTWYYHLYQLPSDLWIYICQFLNLKTIILLSRSNKYVYYSVKHYINFVKKTQPFAYIRLSVSNYIFQKDFIYNCATTTHNPNDIPYIPLYLTDELNSYQILKFKRNNGLYVKFQQEHLIYSIYNYFKHFNVDKYKYKISQVKLLLEKLHNICKTNSFLQFAEKLSSTKKCNKKLTNLLNNFTPQTNVRQNSNICYHLFYFDVKLDNIDSDNKSTFTQPINISLNQLKFANGTI